jgi:predicted nucleic acid-binding protein
VIYLDTSALLKLFLAEGESDAFRRWLSDRQGTTLVTSDLTRLETLRACRRNYSDLILTAQAFLGLLDTVALDFAIIEEAVQVGPADLRSLDAIHLASALAIREELTAFVSYDQRLCDAATAAGLEPVSPGA